MTAYSHDVDVDGAGVAWVSGAGGIRGFHTRGWHYDWTQKRWRTATAVDPVPYAGGGIGDDAVDEVDTPGGFMHNAFRPAGRTQPGAGRLLPARRRQRVGVLLPPRAGLHGRPHARIDILRPTANMAAARRAGEDLAAPEMSAAQQAFLRAEAVGLRADPQLGWLCPLPV